MHRCNEGMEKGQNELFALLNRRADIQSKQQRFDTMLEQINITKSRAWQASAGQKNTGNGSGYGSCRLPKDLEAVSEEISENFRKRKKN